MAKPSNIGKLLMLLGFAVIVVGFFCMFLESKGMGDSFIKVWFVLWAAGTWFTIFGAIFFCRQTPPREIVSFAGRAIALLVLCPLSN
jgi:hypothetical protein